MILEDFVTSYVETALWSSTDDEDEPLDKNYDPGDLAVETDTWIMEDCKRFIERATPLIEEVERLDWEFPSPIWEMAAHDFWLTRNGHGSGFWDGDWPGDIGKLLTEISECFGSYDLYVGDDGLIYGSR